MSIDAEFLSDWMAKQRWYSAKGRSPQLRVKGTLLDEIDGVQVTSYLLIDEASARPVLYHVPVTTRDEPLAGLENSLIGEVDGRFHYDGPHDPAYAKSLLRAIGENRELTGHDSTARGHALSSPGRILSSRVLSGEQSNTSIICDLEGGSVPSVIAKVFRVLHHGENPDVTTQAALTSAGSHRVPTSFGSLEASWPDSGREDGRAIGHLAFVQEFLPGLDDAWRVALSAAAAGEDFTEQAYGLGVATAEVHATLAEALPTVEAGPDEIEGAMVSMRRRIDSAAREVPRVAPFADRIREIYASVEKGAWPRLQRIHGDYHLGQTLSSPELGWVLLDFEGEPMRPMPERSRPDSILRDVAGMLRSFDYVAGALEHNNPPVDARAWASAARKSFVDGYNATAGVDIREQRALLDAFEIDKAVYESLYEARNRPDWLDIPLAAIERLVARSTA
ncbi:phosphotransferase [Glaciihabitans arcticus]|uniref:Maltokinase n=1 Tax=Glaciihabitans arcticus TaxID=2668039 RepID=A0A4Q9GRU5_9MICO|nr:phosphotransferase [Glaciihabitans arcticus]TBN57702.1 phosphotransferase [Glaciihabitans arcticus]